MRGLEQIPWLYDLGLAVLERTGLGRWRSWLAGGARGRTLDLGTGTGRNLPLYRAGVAAVGVDPHPSNAVRAQRRAAGGAALVVARAEALPFRTGAFDTVVAGLVLCSVEDPAAALAEIRRVLAAGGTLRAMEHVRADGFQGRVQDRLQPAWTWLTGGCRPNRETEAEVARAGFEICDEGRRRSGVLRRFVARPLSREASEDADREATG
jgi:SAM-dependent methyltransferase